MEHAVSGNNDEANGSDIPSPVSQPLQFRCADGVLLAGHLWQGGGRGLVIINAATGVLARYYHRYAAFLAGRGFDAIPYDYRGIGASRPPRLKGCGYRCREWGTQDSAAVPDAPEPRAGGRPVMVVGHSSRRFLPRLAPRVGRFPARLPVGR